jgi:ribosome-associated translation inhibitor RaiA
MLQVPLEIAFHNLESSPAVEEEIRARVSELERRYDRLTSCRVRIDQRNKDLTGTIPPVVHIEMGIPGHGDVVVSHEPDHLLRKYQRPDLHKAINEAFRIAERRLLDIKEQRGDFDHLSRGDEVHYNDDIGDTGPIATKVRVKERR